MQTTFYRPLSGIRWYLLANQLLVFCPNWCKSSKIHTLSSQSFVVSSSSSPMLTLYIRCLSSFWLLSIRNVLYRRWDRVTCLLQTSRNLFSSGWKSSPVRGHPFWPLSIKFRCHAPLSDVGPAPHITLQPRTISRVPRTSPHYIALTYILCSYVPRSRLCLTADMVAWYCIVRVYTHHLS